VISHYKEDRARLEEAAKEFEKCLAALELELPDEVWQDVTKRYEIFKDVFWKAYFRKWK